jgi:hypothetical protein
MGSTWGKLLLDRLKYPGSPCDPATTSRLHEEPPVSYSARFPDIPPPTDPGSPMLIGAQWICGLILPEDMPSLAADLLELGLDSPALRRLAGEINVQSRRDIEELVGRTLRELCVPFPMSQTFARHMVTREVAREVIAGKRNLWAASFALARITNWDWKSEVRALYAVYYLLEELDLDCGRPIREIEQDLIRTFGEMGAQTEHEKRLKDLGFGALEGKGWIADDFDGPLPDDLQAYFDGRHPDPLLDDPA